ncbi:hypothetical protein K8R33_03375 [archaeon]|nr:hypothetical protein [archaeon]
MKKKHKKHIKKINYIIPIALIILVVYQNFLVEQTFNTVYNIGDEKDYLSPLNRISEKYDNQRNLTNNLVYFNVNIPTNSKTVTIKTKIKPSNIENEKISIGAKDREDWHYKYNLIYNPKINLTNKKVNQEITETNIIIATEQELTLTPNYPDNYEEKQTTINTTLRGQHTFYFYTEQPIDIQIKKQDINWYEGEDPLTITIKDINNSEIINTTIEDDNIINISKEPAIIQQTILTANLQKGIYKLEFSSFDGLIREIKINTNKIVSKRLFLADNKLYNQETKQSKIYTESKSINLLTYHNQGIQNITYGETKIELEDKHKSQTLILNQPTTLTFPENDIIVESTGYLALNEENYFNPFTNTIIPLENYEQADYIITNYIEPIKEGEYIITETTFNIEDLYIKDNKLSLLFNIPHLGKEEYKNYTIPIDYINITVYKPALI